MLRFANTGHLDAWRESETWRHLVAEVQSLLAEKSSIEIEVKETEPDGGVIEVIVTKMKPGKRLPTASGRQRFSRRSRNFPVTAVPTFNLLAGELGWTTLMRFDTAEPLDKWLKSPERAALLREVEPLVDYAYLQRMETSFQGWFPTDAKTGQGPPNWKAAMLVLLGLFPIVMLETRFLSPRLASLNFSVAMLVGNTISVALTTWLAMPLFIKALGWGYFQNLKRRKSPLTSPELRLFSSYTPPKSPSCGIFFRLIDQASDFCQPNSYGRKIGLHC